MLIFLQWVFMLLLCIFEPWVSLSFFSGHILMLLVLWAAYLHQILVSVITIRSYLGPLLVRSSE